MPERMTSESWKQARGLASGRRMANLSLAKRETVVYLGQTMPSSRPDLAHDVVAGQVAVAFVDVLEPVEVQEEDAQGAGEGHFQLAGLDPGPAVARGQAALDAVDGLGQFREEEFARVQPGQGVGHGPLVERELFQHRAGQGHDVFGRGGRGLEPHALGDEIAEHLAPEDQGQDQLVVLGPKFRIGHAVGAFPSGRRGCRR